MLRAYTHVDGDVVVLLRRPFLLHGRDEYYQLDCNASLRENFRGKVWALGEGEGKRMFA